MFKWLKRVWHIHDWEKWVTKTATYYCLDWPAREITVQVRVCKTCGLEETRSW
jgi:hypothetical protein